MKAVIPAAGLGTRFLPATKAQPKEMLPVVDKPAIQYVVEEAVASGITDILIITGRGKRAIEDHFDRNLELESQLTKKNDDEALREIRRISDLAAIHFVRQSEPLGLGHAVLQAGSYVGEEAFAVLLGDDISVSRVPCLKQLVGQFETLGNSVLGVEAIPQEEVGKYGVVAVEHISDRLYRVTDIVEKPQQEEAPSNLVAFGRYVFTPGLFSCLEVTPPGLGGEIQLTDGIKRLLEFEDVYAYQIEGTRYDLGARLGWIQANIEFALQRQDLRDDLLAYLKALRL
jgi:UTP--glucose-1-phosphate uridylyltransferase